MQATKKYLDELTYKVIGCAIEVHKQIGPGLLESVYEKCFLKELDLQGVTYQKQVWVPLEYKGLELDAELRLDVLVEDLLCVELKAQEGLLPIHDAVLLSYMEMLQKPKASLLIFIALIFLRTDKRPLLTNCSPYCPMNKKHLCFNLCAYPPMWFSSFKQINS